MVYYLCACGYLTYIFTSVLNNYQQRISSIIARDDNLVKSDAKKCQHLCQQGAEMLLHCRPRRRHRMDSGNCYLVEGIEAAAIFC